MVRGRVLDDATSEPIATARVSLLDTARNRIATTLTDEHGAFVLRAREHGLHILEADRLGYRVQRSEPFDVAAEGVTGRDVRLVARALEMDAIVVESYPGQLLHDGTIAGVYARRARSPSVGGNRVLVRGDPDFDGAPSIGDLLPDAIRPAPLWRSRAAWCGYLYVDGRETAFFGGEYKALFLSMSPRDVEAIEYYRDLTSAPIAIRPMESPGDMGRVRRCGILAVWTRGAPR